MRMCFRLQLIISAHDGEFLIVVTIYETFGYDNEKIWEFSVKASDPNSSLTVKDTSGDYRA